MAKRGIHRRLIALSILLGSSFAFSSAEGSNGRLQVDAQGIPLQAPQQVVDRVAYSYQQKAIGKLRKLAEKEDAHGRPNPEILIRLARLEQKTGDIAFRVAHEEAYQTKRPLNLKHYKALLRSNVQTWTDFIRYFPDRPETPEAYLGRAQVYEGLEDNKAAYSDFATATKKYPGYRDIDKLYLILAEYASEMKNPNETIRYLRMIKNRKANRNYGYILTKLAWSYYDLGQPDESLFYVEEYAKFYGSKVVRGNAPSQGSSDLSISDNLLVDAAQIVLMGMESGKAGYSLPMAYDRFSSLAKMSKSKEVLREMILDFAKQLRIKKYDDKLLTFRDIVAKKEGATQATQELVALVCEYQYVTHKYGDLKLSAQYIVEMFKTVKDPKLFKWTQAFLLETSTKIQKFISTNKGSTQSTEKLNEVLVALTRSAIFITEEADDVRLGLQFNLAEALSGQKSYTEALVHYLWVFQKSLRDSSLAKKNQINPWTVGLKAVAIRYNELRNSKVFPVELVARSVESGPQVPMDSKVKEWIDWVAQLRELPEAKDPKINELDLYWFEANRAIYAFKSVESSVKNLEEFAKKMPNSSYAIPSAGLVLDTWIASSDWEKVDALSSDFSEVDAWKKTGLAPRIQKASEDSRYKMLEELYNKQKYEAILEKTAVQEKTFGRSERRLDWLNVVARSAIALKREGSANQYLSEIVNSGQASNYYLPAIQMRAQLQENGLNFQRARQDLTLYLDLAEKPQYRNKVSNEDRALMIKKLAFLSWIEADFESLKKWSAHPLFCKTYPSDCDQYHAMIDFHELDLKNSGRRFASASNAYVPKAQTVEANPTVWNLLTLEKEDRLWTRNQFVSKLDLIRKIGAGWHQLDPLVAFTLTARVNRVVPVGFQRLRKLVRDSVPMQADQAVIGKRIEMIKQIEALATQLLSTLPLLGIHRSVLEETAKMYDDLSNDLLGLSKSAGLSAEDSQAIQQAMVDVARPFVETATQLRTKVTELSLKDAIGNFDENLLARADPEGNWVGGGADLKNRLKGTFYKAIQYNNVVKGTYLIQIAEEKEILSKDLLGVMRAVLLFKNGARDEAYLELKRISKQNLVAEVQQTGVAL